LFFWIAVFHQVRQDPTLVIPAQAGDALQQRSWSSSGGAWRLSWSLRLIFEWPGDDVSVE